MTDDMDISSVIDERTIITHFKASDKDEALEKMSKQLTLAGYIADTETYLRDVYIRECEGATGIGNYIAIPHGKSSAVIKNGVSIAILDEEIPWETLDDNGVKVIVLFAVGNAEVDAEEHLKLLAMFARKLGRDSVVENLLKADSYQDVRSAFLG